MATAAEMSQINALLLQQSTIQSTQALLTGGTITDLRVKQVGPSGMGGSEMGTAMPAPTPQAVLDAVNAWMTAALADIQNQLTALGVT